MIIRKSVAKEDSGEVFEVSVELKVKNGFKQRVACELGV